MKEKVLFYLHRLQEDGFLKEPEAKKLNESIYEIRIRGSSSWRVFYAYYQEAVIVLHIYNKKSQKTSKNELKTALRRYHQYYE